MMSELSSKTRTSTVCDKLCFVQFLHPGGEHRPDQGNMKAWNRGRHQRKFMRVAGRCVREGETREGDLLFWGEWEAQSEVSSRIQRGLPQGPRYIYRPFYTIPASYRGLQNTDPFVFERFMYTLCQQHTVKGPTQLRFLKAGSVILFGSCIGESNFAIDTVFVIKDWIEHDQHTKVHQRVPKAYCDVTLAAWPDLDGGGCAYSNRSYRLYFGASYEEPVAGMFSFFPCQPWAGGGRGFARPTIELPGVITGPCKQGKRLNPQSSVSETARLWREVVRQVEMQGCWLGVHAKMPPERAN